MQKQTQNPATLFPHSGGAQSTTLQTPLQALEIKPCLRSLVLPIAKALGAEKLNLEQLRTGEEETREDEDAPAAPVESTPLFGKDQESPLSMELPKTRLQKRRSKFQFPRLEYPDRAIAFRKYSLRERREPSEDSDLSSRQKCPHSQKMENRGGFDLPPFSNPIKSKPGRQTLCHRPRAFKRLLSINTEAEAESHCAANAVFIANVGDSAKEQRASEFLARLQVEQVNFKELVGQGQKFTSKRLQEMFRTKRSQHEEDSATSVNLEETGTAERRREKKQLEKQNSAIGRIERLSRLSMDLSEVTFQYKPFGP